MSDAEYRAEQIAVVAREMARLDLMNVVRCRDCIGLVETWDGWECERFSGEYHRAEPDGFCAWAERRQP